LDPPKIAEQETLMNRWVASLTDSLLKGGVQGARSGPDRVGLRSIFRPNLESLEDRNLLASVAWVGGGDGFRWNDPNNWSGAALPQPPDSVSILTADQPILVQTDVQVKDLTLAPLSGAFQAPATSS
jgi:hypothetical protein